MRTAQELRANLLAQKLRLEQEASQEADRARVAHARRCEAEEALFDLHFLGYKAKNIIDGSGVSSKYLLPLYKKLRINPGRLPLPAEESDVDTGVSRASSPLTTGATKSAQTFRHIPIRSLNKFGTDRWSSRLEFEVSDTESENDIGEEAETFIVPIKAVENVSMKVTDKPATSSVAESNTSAQSNLLRNTEDSQDRKPQQGPKLDLAIDQETGADAPDAHMVQDEDTGSEKEIIVSGQAAPSEGGMAVGDSVMQTVSSSQKTSALKRSSGNTDLDQNEAGLGAGPGSHKKYALSTDDSPTDVSNTQMTTTSDLLDATLVSPLHVFVSYRCAPLFHGRNLEKVFTPTYNGQFVRDLESRFYCKTEGAGTECSRASCKDTHFRDFVRPKGEILRTILSNERNVSVRRRLAEELQQAQQTQAAQSPEDVIELYLQLKNEVAPRELISLD